MRAASDGGYKLPASERARVRAYYEVACIECGGPAWKSRRRTGERDHTGRRAKTGPYNEHVLCRECRHRKVDRPVQPHGLRYQWGCP